MEHTHFVRRAIILFDANHSCKFPLHSVHTHKQPFAMLLFTVTENALFMSTAIPPPLPKAWAARYMSCGLSPITITSALKQFAFLPL